MKGLILSGGGGTRLRPLTHTGPKQLIPIANKPILHYIIEDFKKAGITDIGIVLGNNMPDKVKESLGDGSSFGVKITYINQGVPLGLAHAVRVSRWFLTDDSFLMYLGDNLIKNGVISLKDAFCNNDVDATIALTHTSQPERFGVAEIKNDRICKVVEKPKNFVSDLVVIGAYCFNNKIFDAIDEIKPSARGELEITDTIHKMIERNNRVNYIHIKGWWKDTGKPQDILEVNSLILDELPFISDHSKYKDVEITGRVSIGDNTKIHQGSIIRGPCIIGNNCIIGPNTYISPYTSIGNSCIIKESEIQSSIIMDGVLIQSFPKIIDSIIGRNSKVVSTKTKPRGHKIVIGENSQLEI